MTVAVRTSRVLGVDLGSRRIGLAVSDPSRIIASPHSVVTRSGDLAVDHRRVAEVAAETEAGLLVVGLPLSLSGHDGPAARAARDEAAALAVAVGLPVETFDERFTTVTAQRALLAGGVRRADRKAMVDKVAAAVMLQSWLDRKAGAPS
ncbi:MAG: Holliday junction resolvase RuvX [Acidimicrobiales bacterium]